MRAFSGQTAPLLALTLWLGGCTGTTTTAPDTGTRWLCGPMAAGTWQCERPDEADTAAHRERIRADALRLIGNHRAVAAERQAQARATQRAGRQAEQDAERRANAARLARAASEMAPSTALDPDYTATTVTRAPATAVAAAPTRTPPPAAANDSTMPRRVGDLPNDFVAPQLIAFASVEQAENWLGTQPFRDAILARVEANGEIRFAVIAGIYPSEASARSELSWLPQDLRDSMWLRPVSNLKAAIARAEALVEAR